MRTKRDHSNNCYGQNGRKVQCSNKRQGKHNRRGGNGAVRFFTGVFAVLLIIVCSFGFGSFFSSAHGNSKEDPAGYKYYKSIEIKKGDSLWSIAEAHMGNDYESVYEYMDELADINHIDIHEMDELQEGNYLTIVYSSCLLYTSPSPRD